MLSMSDAAKKSMGMDIVKIVVGSVTMAVVYGLARELIMANTDISYYTMYLPHMSYSQSPTEFGLKWGLAGLWPAGLVVGILLALCSQMGDKPRLSVGQVLNMLLKGITGIFIVTMLALAVLLRSNDGKSVDFQPDPSDTSGRFLAVLQAHTVSNVAGIIVVVWLCYRIFTKRSKMAAPTAPVTSPDVA